MSENFMANDVPNQNNCSESPNEYMRRAASACEAGDMMLGMHLYLAAYEKAVADPAIPDGMALAGLHEAWHLACSLRERSMAEYVFEKLEPYLTPEEVSNYALELQDLALDHLAEFGISRDEIENMAEMITSDLMANSDSIVKVESIKLPNPPEGLLNALKAAQEEASEDGEGSITSLIENKIASGEAKPKAIEPKPAKKVLNYSNLVGYDQAIQIMRDLGIGLQRDENFHKFIKMMNSRHGLHRMPALDTMLFRAPVIEDAMRFVEATAGEIGLPVLRMNMEEGVGGIPVLCISTLDNQRPRLNRGKNRFEGPAILVIEDLDMWVVPSMPEGLDGLGGFMMANVSRGAREAVSLIRSAVEDPDVFVLATATNNGTVDPFFYELLEPMTIIDINNPSLDERCSLWLEIQEVHPSLRGHDVNHLAQLSEGLPRYDIYVAAREALEEAYKMGMSERMFVPVPASIIYEKLAASHDPSSAEYKVLEDLILQNFREELDSLENLDF